MKHSLFSVLGLFASATMALMLFTSCNGCRRGTPDAAPADSIASLPVETEETDTLVGYVGDGTSMHNLEFLPLEGDSMELELSDDVNRRAELEVGRMIAIAVRWNDSNEMQVVATMDTSEVYELPYDLRGN